MERRGNRNLLNPAAVGGIEAVRSVLGVTVGFGKTLYQARLGRIENLAACMRLVFLGVLFDVVIVTVFIDLTVASVAAYRLLDIGVCCAGPCGCVACAGLFLCYDFTGLWFRAGNQTDLLFRQELEVLLEVLQHELGERS
jgi:hypothetical protein